MCRQTSVLDLVVRHGLEQTHRVDFQNDVSVVPNNRLLGPGHGQDGQRLATRAARLPTVYGVATTSGRTNTILNLRVARQRFLEESSVYSRNGLR